MVRRPCGEEAVGAGGSEGGRGAGAWLGPAGGGSGRCPALPPGTAPSAPLPIGKAGRSLGQGPSNTKSRRPPCRRGWMRMTASVPPGPGPTPPGPRLELHHNNTTTCTTTAPHWSVHTPSPQPLNNRVWVIEGYRNPRLNCDLPAHSIELVSLYLECTRAQVRLSDLYFLRINISQPSCFDQCPDWLLRRGVEAAVPSAAVPPGPSCIYDRRA
jgi:hypothetical protein